MALYYLILATFLSLAVLTKTAGDDTGRPPTQDCDVEVNHGGTGIPPCDAQLKDGGTGIPPGSGL